MLTSTKAWSFQREEVFLVSKNILFATSYEVNKKMPIVTSMFVSNLKLVFYLLCEQRIVQLAENYRQEFSFFRLKCLTLNKLPICDI